MPTSCTLNCHRYWSWRRSAIVLEYHSSTSATGISAEHIYTPTALDQMDVWQGTLAAPTETSGFGILTFGSPGLSGLLGGNSRKSVCAAYRMYCRLQQCLSCWSLHCADVEAGRKPRQKTERSNDSFVFMRIHPETT